MMISTPRRGGSGGQRWSPKARAVHQRLDLCASSDGLRLMRIGDSIG